MAAAQRKTEEKQTFEQCKEQGYVKQAHLKNVFGDWCAVHQKPYIYIEGHGKHVTVVMDLVFCEYTGYQEDNLFEEKLLTVLEAIGINDPSIIPGGTYNHVSAVLPEYADYVARSFYAIYQQHLSLPVKAPAFPKTAEGARIFSHVQDSKEQKYALLSKGQRWLHWRWKAFCTAYHWPSIILDEARKGTAKVEVRLQASAPLQPDVKQSIIRAGQEAGLKADTTLFKASDNYLICRDTHIYMLRPIPTMSATRLARDIAAILDSAGYFPAIDESWHE